MTCYQPPGCIPDFPYNVIAQAVNDALADRMEELQGYTNSAAISAASASTSASYAFDYMSQTQEYRDQTQTIFNSAQALVPRIAQAASDIQDTAELIERISQNASSYQIVNYFYETIGGEIEIAIPSNYDALTVQAIYTEGSRQDAGYGFTYNAVTKVITLTQPIPDEAAGVVLTIQLGQTNVDSPETVLSALTKPSGANLIGTNSGSTVQDDLDGLIKGNLRTLQEVARSYNLKNSEVILSSDTTSTLEGKVVIYDTEAEKAWSLPDNLSATSTIVSVDGNVLHYADANSEGTVTLSAAPDLVYELATPGFINIPADNVYIPASSDDNIAVSLKAFTSQFASLLSYPDIIGDGVTDDREAIQFAIDHAASAGLTLYIPKGTYAFGNWFSLPSNSHLVFDEAATFKLLNATTLPNSSAGMGGFLVTGYNYNDFYQGDGTTIKMTEAVNVTTVNMTLDCNNLPGENGISGVYCRNCKHISPTVLNTLHTDTELGGRSFQFEGNLIQDILIKDAYIDNCSIGINSQGLVGTNKNVQCVVYDGIRMRNVGVPFMVYGQATNPDQATGLIHSVTVYNAVLHNCGAPRFSSPSGGGIICSDRGAGLVIQGLRLVNDSDYGAIGAIFRGPMFNVELSNATIETPYIVAPIDQSPVTFGSPSGAAFNSFVRTRNVKVTANMDMIAKSHSTAVGPHDVELDIDLNTATIAALFDTNIAASSTLGFNAMLQLTDYKTGNTTGKRGFRDLFLAGNTPALCMTWKSTESVWVPADSSGASLTLTPTGNQAYTRINGVVTVYMNILFPTTADTRVVAIGGLPFVGRAGLTYAGIATPLNGATGSLVVVKAGENFIRFLTATGGNVTNASLSGKQISLVLQYAS